MNAKLDINLRATEHPPIDLIQADCRQALKRLPDNSVHLVLTDPPYFLDGLDNCWNKGKADSIRGTGAIGGLPVGMKFDPKQGQALQVFIGEVAQELTRILVPGGFLLTFSQPRLSPRMACGLEDAGFEIRDIYAWRYTKRAQMKAFSQSHFVDRMDLSKAQKNNIKRSLCGRKTPQLRPQYEAIIMAQNPRQGTFVENWLQYRAGLVDVTRTLDGSSPSTVMTVEKPDKDERASSDNHLTMKPIKLLSHLIEVFSEERQIVLDPFLGSGSTALAALKTGRRCIGIEIEKSYLQTARKRLRIAI